MSTFGYLGPTDLLNHLHSYQMSGYEKTLIFNNGTFHDRVNICSQQERAMWLIYLLEKLRIARPGKSKKASKIAIIGAGFGGVSACAAALSRGYRVDIFDRYPYVLSLQRNSDRLVHPHIIKFPLTGFNKKSADLPILNWEASECYNVVKNIAGQYNQIAKSHKSSLCERFGVEVSQIEEQSNGEILVRWEKNGESTTGRSSREVRGTGFYDVVILAVGFGIELNTSSYWSKDNLNQVELGGHKRTFITGIGDGGLIDAIRAMLIDYNVDEYVDFLLNNQKNKKLMGHLQDMAAQVQSCPPIHDKTWFYKSLEDLKRCSSLDPLFNRIHRERCYSSRHVTLNGLPDITQMSYKGASWLNQLLIYCFYCVDSSFNYIPGEFQKITENTCQIQNKVYDFDRLILRHGCDRINNFSKFGITINAGKPMLSTDSVVPTELLYSYLSSKK